MKHDLVARFALATALSFSAGMTVENYRPHEIVTPMLMLMPDGTKYAGISPETNKLMFTTEADAPIPYSWTTGIKYRADLDASGHKDWRMRQKMS